jgi:hypothetical protein
MLSGAAGSTPILRKYVPINGKAMSASWAVPWSGRSPPKCRHHWMPTAQASHGKGTGVDPTTRAGRSGMRSQPETSIRNQ